MRDLNLIVIGDRACGTTRAYLTYLAAAALRPRAVWVIDFFAPSPRAIRWRRMPLVGSKLANAMHAKEPKPAALPSPEVAQLARALQQSVPHPIDFIDQFDFGRYAASMREMVAEDFTDPFLQRAMLANRDCAFLFTNGGIVPRDLLARQDLRIFHVHPGLVPELRGSDCFWWSLLEGGRLGVSCFYMAPGIDEGPLLAQAEFGVPNFSYLKEHCSPAFEDALYRAFALALDPHLRAMLFADTLRRTSPGDLRQLPAQEQSLPTRPAYLWMHPRLRFHVLERLVSAPPTSHSDKLELLQ